jgi:hypothetical protein
LLLGCTSSPLDPDATVTVRGTALAPDGAPLADRPVRLDSDLAASDLLLAVPTIGLACVGDACGGALDEQRTDADGRFALTTTGAETQTSFGGLRTLAVSVSAPPSAGQVTGASITARFIAQVVEPVLSPLQLVDPGLQLKVRGGQLEARWDANARAQELRWLSGSDGRTVWTVPATGGAAALDARVLEGSRGAAVLTGAGSDATDGSDVTAAWVSPGVAFATGAGVPASRGAPCSAEDRTCLLTDGDLASPAGPPAATCPEGGACIAAVELRLADAPVVDLLVLRGCDEGCDVATDGPAGLQQLGRLAGDGALALPAAAVSRVLVTGTDLTALREISAWAPVRAEAAQPEVGLDAADPFPARTDDALPVLPLAVAVVLLATAVAGVAATLARRARRPSYTTPRDSPTTDVVDARAITGDAEPLRAEHSSVSSGSRRGLAEIVAVALGLTSIILYAGLKLAPWLIEPGDLPLDEVVGDFVPYLLFGPPLLLTCPGTVVALVVAVLQRQGRLRASTWLLALPAVLLSVQFAVS